MSIAIALACLLLATDGDSIMHDCHQVRLKGFNAAEQGRHARCEREAILAGKARDMLGMLLTRGRRNGTLEIRYQRKRDGTIKMGRYGRRLAWVLVDGRNVGDDLIAAGLAHAMDWDAGERRILDYWCRKDGADG